MSLISFNLSRKSPPRINACACNSGDLEIRQSADGGHYVYCRLCKKTGTTEATKQSAIKWWNHVN